VSGRLPAWANGAVASTASVARNPQHATRQLRADRFVTMILLRYETAGKRGYYWTALAQARD